MRKNLESFKVKLSRQSVLTQGKARFDNLIKNSSAGSQINCPQVLMVVESDITDPLGSRVSAVVANGSTALDLLVMTHKRLNLSHSCLVAKDVLALHLLIWHMI